MFSVFAYIELADIFTEYNLDDDGYNIEVYGGYSN